MSRKDLDSPIFTLPDQPRVIWKFPFPGVVGYWEFEAPVTFTPIYLATQHEVPTLWAEVDPSSERTTQRFMMVGTGGTVTGDEKVHVGSFQTEGGNWIWHVYWLVE